MSCKVFQHTTACYVYESPVNPSDHKYIYFAATMVSEQHLSYTIIVENVIKAISNLNTDKSDGIGGTCSNHFIHASHRFYIVFSVLINAMIVHGYSADELLQSVLVSIPKDARGDLPASDHYRGIPLSSALSNDYSNGYIILETHSDDLKTAHLQFAYKKEHSTTMCTAVIKEVVAHYTSNGSFVYGFLIDAIKAFDRVNYGKLFSLLCERNLPGVVIRFLLDSYSRQNVFTRWNNVLSNAIHVENGVKKGGVLSPILFCVYFDELLKDPESSGMGCYIGHHFYGCVGYADDVKLLCPSINGLQSMMNVCENFSDEFDVTFNTKKTLCICYGSDNNATLRQVSLNGVKYLGNRQWNTLVMSLCTTCTIMPMFIKKRGGGGDFIAAVNKMNSVFASVHAELKV